MASKADVSLFVSQRPEVTTYVLVYVDDIIITSSSSRAADCLIRQLQDEFAVKDLGPLHYFLGVEILPTQGGIVMSQKK